MNRGSHRGLIALFVGLALIGCQAGDCVCPVAPPPPGPPVASVVISPNPVSLTVGNYIWLSARTNDSAGNAITGPGIEWNTTDSTIVRMADGRITGVSVGGPVNVTATNGGVTGTAKVTVGP